MIKKIGVHMYIYIYELQDNIPNIKPRLDN